MSTTGAITPMAGTIRCTRFSFSKPADNISRSIIPGLRQKRQTLMPAGLPILRLKDLDLVGRASLTRCSSIHSSIFKHPTPFCCHFYNGSRSFLYSRKDGFADTQSVCPYVNTRFPTLGRPENKKKRSSQCWENVKKRETAFPNVRKI